MWQEQHYIETPTTAQQGTPTISALICDDEPIIANYLQRQLQQCWPELRIVDNVRDGHSALKAISRYQPDIVFLDIQMPGCNGLEIAALIPQCKVVFVTAFDQYAVNAFEHAAVDYLLKPIADARLLRCILRLQQYFNSKAQGKTVIPNNTVTAQTAAVTSPPLPLSVIPTPRRWLTLSQGQHTRLIALSEVLYFQANDKYTDVITTHECLLMRQSLKQLLLQLDPEEFRQIHRGTVVAIAALDRIEKDIFGRYHAILKHQQRVLAISRSFSGQFKPL
jgi:DNA-binding LytR/AlgR family response regulator